MSSNKSPGPDGFSTEFIVTYFQNHTGHNKKFDTRGPGRGTEVGSTHSNMNLK